MLYLIAYSKLITILCHNGATMLVRLPYGRKFVDIDLPDTASVVYPQELPTVADPHSEIRRAMEHPIGCLPLRELAVAKSDAAVVINDITRPAPSQLMLEEIIIALEEGGIPEDEITVIIACGNHRGNTPKEIQGMVGADLASRLRIINHDCEDEESLTFYGETGLDLPVWVNSLVAHASLKILTGLITPHHSAGYSGGRKSIMPGVAGLSSLKRHHSFPIRPYQPAYGCMEGNPFHEGALTAARMVGIDFILNVVKNSSGGIVKAVAGEMEAAHEHGVAICEKSWVIKLRQKYDIVIVTPGGHPRDINLHQAQKAMSTAETVIEDDGVIVLVAECPEGIGRFANWLKRAETPREVIERFRQEGFTREHSSKAFMCARALEQYTVIVSCSGIEEDDLAQMFFRYAPSPQTAVDEALALKGMRSNVLVLPYAAACVPTVTK
jgi:nickel-dependent lactate racemase